MQVRQPSAPRAFAMSTWSVAITTSAAPLAFARSAAQATSGLPATSASIFPGRRVERMRAGITTVKSGRASSGFLVGAKPAGLVLEHHGNVVLHREGEPVGLAHQLRHVLLPG